MLIREITLTNFLTLYGEQTITFPAGPKHSTAVILGPNNSGKSSFVKALQFLLHQRLPGCKEETAWLLINNRHRDETGVKIEAIASVTATFAFGATELTIRRSVRARRTGKGEEHFSDADISFTYLKSAETSSKFIADDDGTIQRKLAVLCPDTLLEAFFFSGEPLDGKLLRGVQQVRESLEEYLSIRQWRDAAEAARELRSHYASETQKLAQKNRELDTILREEAHLQSRIDEKRKAKTKTETALTDQREALDQRQAAILGIANQSQMRTDVEERERLQIQLKKHEQSLESAKSEICEEIGRSVGYPFLLPFVGKAQKILSRLREENVLPADLSSGFVERVVAMKACICGREHTKDSRSAWHDYLEKTLQADVGTKLATLSARVDPKAPNCVQRNVAEIATRISDARDRVEAAVVGKHTLDGTIATLTQRIQESPIEELRRLEIERRKLEASVKETEKGIESLEAELKSLVVTMKKKKEERAKMKISPDVEKRVRELERCQTMADSLADFIDNAIEALRRQFHKNLQEAMTEMYDEHVTDGTIASISPTTLLPTIMQNGRRVTNLGGGQSQLLGLAYITSVARLRNALHAGMSHLGIKLGVVGEQAFVLDCPFSGMEQHYIEAAVKGLCSAAKQTVFLLHGSQWLAAKRLLEPATTTAWGVHMHAPKAIIAKLKPEDRTYSFRGKETVLATESRAVGEAVYSELQPLKGT